VNGLRGDTDLIERIRYDLYYIEKWTFLGDFWISIISNLDDASLWCSSIWFE
jgi:lipopolysaccharide/colanic/teichoic acid biosynthesis glycosyltransferase